MTTTVFFRLLREDEKAAALADAISQISLANPDPRVHVVAPASFRQMPGSPFSYWVSEKVRRLYKELPQFTSNERTPRAGGHPSDDFKYLRLFWEVSVGSKSHEWHLYYKGGNNSPFFDDTALVVDWDSSRQTYRGYYGQPGRSSERPSNYQYYLLPGLTCPNRPHRRGHFAHLPPGGIFGHTSPVVQLPRGIHWATCAFLNSTAFIGLLHLLMARGVDGGQTLKYEVRYISSVPIPDVDQSTLSRLEQLGQESYRLVRELHTHQEGSHVFWLPALLQSRRETLTEKGGEWQERCAGLTSRLAAYQTAIDDIAFSAYAIDGEDRLSVEQSVQDASASDKEDEAVCAESEEPEGDIALPDNRALVAELVSYLVGAAFGRWDIRFATGEFCQPEFPDPFAPFPISAPGMIHGDDGFPVCETPKGYPITIDEDGILVHDAEHHGDIVRRVRSVLEAVLRGRAEFAEREIVDALGIAELSDYFCKPGKGGFWDDHISRYTKSRRKAPIYWLLQSSKKNYAVWLYYHRLDKDILFKVVVNYVEPKIRLVENRLEGLRDRKGSSGKAAKKLDKDIEKQETFLSELRDFEDRLRRAANLHLEPDLNDGVVLNIAPLWELVPWREAKDYWEELLEGKYEWSSIGKQLREKGLVK